MSARSMRNLGQTILKRRKRTADPMQAFDQLPTPLRSWLASAALPWSPRSAKRAYSKALAKTGNTSLALARLDAIQRRQITKDAMRVWGNAHPATQAEQTDLI